MIDAIENRVETGRYGSTDEAMLAAVDALLREEKEHEERMKSIRQQIRSSIEDPAPSLSSAEMRAHVEQLYARHRD
jgi:antitoxin ParD1/3/4